MGDRNLKLSDVETRAEGKQDFVVGFRFSGIYFSSPEAQSMSDPKVTYNRDADGTLISKTYTSENGNSKTYEPYETPDLLTHFINTATGDDDHGPLISSSSSDSACCYVTGACLNSMNKPWNSSDEMKAMKVMTKEHILKSFSGKKDYTRYGKLGPELVKALNDRPEAKEIWKDVYAKLQCVSSKVFDGKLDEAYAMYKKLIYDLNEMYIG